MRYYRWRRDIKDDECGWKLYKGGNLYGGEGIFCFEGGYHTQLNKSTPLANSLNSQLSMSSPDPTTQSHTSSSSTLAKKSTSAP
jgi:hypothetical protein